MPDPQKKTSDAQEIIEAANVLGNDARWDNAEAFLDLIGEDCGIFDQNIEHVRKLLKIVYVGLTLSNKERTAENLLTETTLMLTSIHGFLHSNLPTDE